MFSPLTFFRNDRLNDIISRFSGVREQDLQRRPLHPGNPILQPTQGQMDGFTSQLPFK